MATLTAPVLDMFGFTPVTVEASALAANTKPYLVFREWDGAAYIDIITLNAENENDSAYWNISDLPLFSPITALPTFGTHQKKDGLVKKYQVFAVERNADGTETTIDTLDRIAINGAYPEDLSFTDYSELNFLSHQPRSKEIYPDEPNWLYFYIRHNDSSLSPNLRAVYADGSIVNISDITIIGDKGEVAAFDINRSKNLLPDLDNLVYFEFSLTLGDANDGASQWSGNSETFTFYLKSEYDEPDWGVQYFLFFDQFGAMVTLPANGKRKKTQSVKRNFSKKTSPRSYSKARHTTQQTRNVNMKTYETSTGWLENANYYQALFNSELVWLIDKDNSQFIAVNIESTSFTYHEDFENIIQIKFKYSFEEKKYYHPTHDI